MKLAFDSGQYSFSLKECKTARDVIEQFRNPDGNISYLHIKNNSKDLSFVQYVLDPATGEESSVTNNFDIDMELDLIEAKIALDEYHNIRLTLICNEKS